MHRLFFARVVVSSSHGENGGLHETIPRPHGESTQYTLQHFLIQKMLARLNVANEWQRTRVVRLSGRLTVSALVLRMACGCCPSTRDGFRNTTFLSSWRGGEGGGGLETALRICEPGATLSVKKHREKVLAKVPDKTPLFAAKGAARGNTHRDVTVTGVVLSTSATR